MPGGCRLKWTWLFDCLMIDWLIDWLIAQLLYQVWVYSVAGRSLPLPPRGSNCCSSYFLIDFFLPTLIIIFSGGARVFAARGKRLCCRPPHPVAYLEIWKGTFQVYIFRSFQILAHFFAVNISTIFLHPKVPRRRGTSLNTPLVPPVRSAIDILMVTRRQWCGLWTVGLR